MYGKTVKIDNLEIFVPCNPDTRPERVLEQATSQIIAWRREPDFAAQGKSIAFRHNITVVG